MLPDSKIKSVVFFSTGNYTSPCLPEKSPQHLLKLLCSTSTSSTTKLSHSVRLAVTEIGFDKYAKAYFARRKNQRLRLTNLLSPILRSSGLEKFQVSNLARSPSTLSRPATSQRVIKLWTGLPKECSDGAKCRRVDSHKFPPSLSTQEQATIALPMSTFILVPVTGTYILEILLSLKFY